MGIAILWVMLFHSGIPAPENTILRVFWYITVSFGGGCAVNLFVIVSGMGLMMSNLEKGSEKIGGFYKRRFVRLLPAYFLVAIVFYILKGYNFLEIVYNISFGSLFAEGVRDFWYIALMVILYLLFPLFAAITKKIGIWGATGVFLTINIGLEFLLYYCNQTFWQNTEVLVIRMLCFWIGCLIGYIINQNNRKLTLISLIICVLINLCLLVPIKFNVVSCGLRMQRYIFVFLSIIVCVTFALLLKYLPKFINTVLSYFGGRSLEIYLVHVSIGILLKSIVPNNIVALIIYFVASILLAEGVYQVTNKKSFLFKKLKREKSK